MTFENAREYLKELQLKDRAYRNATGLVYYDGRTGAPSGSSEARGMTLSILSGEQYKLDTCPETVEAVRILKEHMDELDAAERRVVELTDKTLTELEKIPFDEYVAFSQSRHAPVFCGEFGTSAICAPQGERVKWYRLVSGLLEERGIARCSWDYYGSFGVFCNTYPECGVTVKPTFPEGLNVPLLEAMGLHAPEEVQ